MINVNIVNCIFTPEIAFNYREYYILFDFNEVLGFNDLIRTKMKSEHKITFKIYL